MTQIIAAQISDAALLGATIGPAGVGITTIAVNGAGHLILSKTDGSTIDAGYVVGEPGAPGAPGSPGVGISSAAINGSGHLVLTKSDGSTVDAGYVLSSGGGGGGAGIAGTSFRAGVGAPSAGLGAAGDTYLNETTGELYQNQAGSWVDTGSTLHGVVGTAGVAGVAGAVGAPGASIRTGSGNPPSGLGAANDIYVNLASGEVWTNVAGTWSDTGSSLRGPAGAAGAPGTGGLPTPAAGNTVTTFDGTALLPIVIGGATEYIKPADLFTAQGEIMPAANAAAANLTDTFWSNQGGPSLVVQSLSSVAGLVRSTLNSYGQAELVVSGAILLDASNHNGRNLVFTSPGSVAPPSAYSSFGDGSFCDITNLSGGNISFTTVTAVNTGGIVATGATVLPNFGIARIKSTTIAGSSGTIILSIAGGSTAPALTLIAPGGVLPNTPYTISGSISGYGVAPTLTLSVDGGAFAAIPAGSTVSTSAISLAMPGLAAGNHTVVVKDANGVLSNTITFADAAPPETLTVTAPAAQTAQSPFTVAGTYTNGPPAALDYSLDGGSTWAAAASPTIASGAFSFSVTIGAANPAQVIKVRDHTTTTVIGTSAAFVVSAAPAGAANTYSISWPYGVPPLSETAHGTYAGNSNFAPGQYFNMTNISTGVQLPLSTSTVVTGFAASPTVPPGPAAANVAGFMNTNGYVATGQVGGVGFADSGTITIPTGGGASTYYMWASADGGANWSVYGNSSPVAFTFNA